MRSQIQEKKIETRLTIFPSHFDYIASRHGGAAYSRKNYNVNEYAEELKSKVYLLKHFEKYIMERLYGDYSYTFEDIQRTKGMDFVQKYLRMKHVIVFKLSHDVLQVWKSCQTSLVILTMSFVAVQLLRPHESHSILTSSRCYPHREG